MAKNEGLSVDQFEKTWIVSGYNAKSGKDVQVFKNPGLKRGDLILIDDRNKSSEDERLGNSAIRNGLEARNKDNEGHSNAHFTHIGLYFGKSHVLDIYPGYGVRIVSIGYFLACCDNALVVRSKNFRPSLDELKEIALLSRSTTGYPVKSGVARKVILHRNGTLFDSEKNKEQADDCNPTRICTTFMSDILYGKKPAQVDPENTGIQELKKMLIFPSDYTRPSYLKQTGRELLRMVPKPLLPPRKKDVSRT